MTNVVRPPIFSTAAATGRKASADRDSSAGFIIEGAPAGLFYSVTATERPGGMGGAMVGDRSIALRFARRQDAGDFAQAFHLGGYRIVPAEVAP